MKVRELLEKTEFGCQSCSAKYSDGSGTTDTTIVTIILKGRGTPLDAEIRKVHITRNVVSVVAKGKEG